MKEKLMEIFEQLQDLDIKATFHNTEIIRIALYGIYEVIKEIEAKEGDENGRPAADPEGSECH